MNVLSRGITSLLADLHRTVTCILDKTETIVCKCC